MKNTIPFWLTLIAMALTINTQGQSKYLSKQQADTISMLTQNLTGLSMFLKNRQHGKDSTNVADVIRINNSLQNSMDKLLNNCLLINNSKEITQKIYKDLSNYNDLLLHATQQSSIDSVNQIVSFIDDDLRLKFSPAFNDRTSNETNMVEIKIEVFDSANKKLSGYCGFEKPQWA